VAQGRGYPWHSPPHRPNFGHLRFLISASCFEHRHYIGHTPERIDNFSRDLVAVFAAHAGQTFAWCVLPNHYHALVEAPNVKALLHELGLLQGRTAHAWNGEEQAPRAKSFLPRCRTRDALGPPLLGDAELCTSQSRAARLRGPLDGLAVEQCNGVSGGNRC
jgi:REP element-mobilizing transposase RayT